MHGGDWESARKIAQEENQKFLDDDYDFDVLDSEETKSIAKSVEKQIKSNSTYLKRK